MLEIRYIIQYLLIGIIALQVIRKKMTLLQAYAFFIPFFGIDYDIGVRYTISQLILFLLNASFLITAFTNTRLLQLKGLNGNVIFFLLYAFVSAFLLSSFVINFIPTKNPGFLRNEGRYISQIINFSLLFSIFYIAYYHIKSLNDVYSLLKYFIYGIIVTSSIGIMQEIVFVFTSVDITPLALDKSNIRTAGSFDYFDIPMIRICSLSGEPKSLGMYATLGIILIHVLNTLQLKLFKRQSLFSVLFIVTLILTLSSSGFILLAILWVLSEIILRYFQLLPRISTAKFFSWIVIGIVIVTFSGPLDDIINDRVTERDKIEDFDAVIIKGLKENPQYIIYGSGLGNIHNIAAPYINQFENLGFMEGSIFVAKSGYLRIISETGVIGFLLFLFFNAQIIVNAFYSYNKYKLTVYALFATLSILALVSYLARTYVTEFYLLMMAIANTLYKKQLY